MSYPQDAVPCGDNRFPSLLAYPGLTSWALIYRPFGAVQLLAFDEFGEHFFGVDGDEDAAAAGQDFVLFVEYFGGVDVGAALYFYFAAFHAEGLVQRDGLEVFDGHLSGERHDVMQFIYFAHGIVEDAGDNASVAVAGRSGVALAQAKFADESLAIFVEDEFEVHAVFVIGAADEAVVLLHFVVAGVVALDARWHGGILT